MTASQSHHALMFTPCRPRLAYVGLGNIGLPVARNLATYPSKGKIKVWNRSQHKYDSIPSAEGVKSIKDLFVDSADEVLVVFTSFPNDQVALELYGDLMRAAGSVKEGSKVIFVDQSTLHPNTSGESHSPWCKCADLV